MSMHNDNIYYEYIRSHIHIFHGRCTLRLTVTSWQAIAAFAVSVHCMSMVSRHVRLNPSMIYSSSSMKYNIPQASSCFGCFGFAPDGSFSYNNASFDSWN